MKNRKYAILVFLLVISCSGCGTKPDAYYSTEEKAQQIQGTAVSHAASTSDTEDLSEKSTFEEVDYSLYLQLADYHKVCSIPESETETTDDVKANYEQRKKLVNQILDAVAEQSVFTDKINQEVENKRIELLVSDRNGATQSGTEDAKQYVQRNLIVYALQSELGIMISDEEYQNKAADLAEFYGYDSTEAMIEAMGIEQIRMEITAYTSAGIASELIDANIVDNVDGEEARQEHGTSETTNEQHRNDRPSATTQQEPQENPAENTESQKKPSLQKPQNTTTVEPDNKADETNNSSEDQQNNNSQEEEKNNNSESETDDSSEDEQHIDLEGGIQIS